MTPLISRKQFGLPLQAMFLSIPVSHSYSRFCMKAYIHHALDDRFPIDLELSE